jgi:hypothetical protein
MLRTMHYRNPDLPYGAGEPEAWEVGRARPAPWHTPYEEPAPASRADWHRRAPSRHYDDGPAPYATPREPAPRASAEDFRSLARSIEHMRNGRSAPRGREREPMDRQSARPSRPAPDRFAEERWQRFRHETDERPDGRGESLSREIASAADKADVRRLEDLLNEVLARLERLDEAERRAARQPAHRERPQSSGGASRRPAPARSTCRTSARRPEEAPTDERAGYYRADRERPRPARRLWP